MDQPNEIVAQLGEDNLLRQLSPPQLDNLLRHAVRRGYAAGDTIITQGDETGDFALLLLSGTLKISLVSASGREIILNYCAAGELVGEIALLDSGPRTATVTAVVPSSALLLPTHTFIEAISTSPATIAGVMRELAKRVRQQNLVIESDRTFSMGPRLARALVRLIDEESSDGGLLYNPSQSDLGAFAGLARENVNRLLSEWEDQGVIARRGRTLAVRDPEYLKLLAEFGDDA